MHGLSCDGPMSFWTRTSIICSGIRQKIPLQKPHGKLTNLHEKSLFLSAWRLSWYWASSAKQTYVIAAEKCDRMVLSHQNQKTSAYFSSQLKMVGWTRKSMDKAISLVNNLQRRAKAERNFLALSWDKNVVNDESKYFRVKFFYVFGAYVHSTCV